MLSACVGLTAMLGENVRPKRVEKKKENNNTARPSGVFCFFYECSIAERFESKKKKGGNRRSVWRGSGIWCRRCFHGCKKKGEINKKIKKRKKINK